MRPICSFLVPVEGLSLVYSHQIDPIRMLQQRGSTGLVKVDLHKDEQIVATVHFSIVDGLRENERATAITNALCGSFVKVTGPAIFSGLTRRQADSLLYRWA